MLPVVVECADGVVHPAGVGINITEFVLDAVPPLPEFGSIEDGVCDEMEMDVSVLLFFGPPDVVCHSVLFPEFGEELVE